jgi:tagaturonate reductase
MLKKLNRTTAGIVQNRPVKVLQFGGGNFLHAFADWMIDLMNEKTSFNGNIEIVQPLRKGRGSAQNHQENLYHVSINGIQNGNIVADTRLITCIVGTIHPYDEFDKLLKSAENPHVEFIISNTTESGISFNSSDQNPEVPSESFPGKLTSLLYHRFKHFRGAHEKGLTILPCELIENNALTLKKIILQYIELWNLPMEFKNWIVRSNYFYNTLVDRIVPGFPKDIIQDIQQKIGYDDQHVVMAEPFYFWAIEAPESLARSFPGKESGLDIKFVDDLTPYRVRKVRILNGAHTAMVPVAYLNGLKMVRESINDPLIGRFIKDAVFHEIIPSLEIKDNEIHLFANDVIERFQNPFIKHELSSIALNSISKFKVRVLPSILSYIEREKKLPARLIYSLAALIRFYKGDWRGEKLPVNDSGEVVDFFSKAWSSSDNRKIALDVLSNKALWGTDLSTITRLTDLVSTYLDQLAKSENGSKHELPDFS